MDVRGNCTVVFVDTEGNELKLTDTVTSGCKMVVTDVQEQRFEYKIIDSKTVPVTSVTLDQTGAELEAGETQQLTATVLPENATNKAVTWSTSDASVATVKNGLVTAVAEGTATITVTTEDGGKTASCTVTVKAAPVPDVSVESVTLDQTSAELEAGETQQLTAIVLPENATNKAVTWSTSDASVATVENGLVTAVAKGTATITAVFEKVDVEESGLPFTDVKSGDWYHDAVEYVYGEGLMAGTSGKLFTPNGTLSRGMIVQILYSLEGKPETDADSVFDDVKAGAWYADAVNWAASVGVVSGYGNGKFGPDDSITREQLAAILRQYAGLKGYKTEASGKLDGFADADQVSGWATEAMQWAVSNGLMSGKNGGMLDPKGTATRAETAVILMQFCEKIAE